MSKITVSSIPQLSTLVIKQSDGRDFFIATPDSIIMTISSLTFLLTFLLENGFISPRTLEGILEEFNTDKGPRNIERT